MCPPSRELKPGCPVSDVACRAPAFDPRTSMRRPVPRAGMPSIEKDLPEHLSIPCSVRPFRWPTKRTAARFRFGFQPKLAFVSCRFRSDKRQRALARLLQVLSPRARLRGPPDLQPLDSALGLRLSTPALRVTRLDDWHVDPSEHRPTRIGRCRGFRPDRRAMSAATSGGQGSNEIRCSTLRPMIAHRTDFAPTPSAASTSCCDVPSISEPGKAGKPMVPPHRPRLLPI